ncbi:hypothetical protein BS50DRAFT_193840 [Corynespora cassiicola Philippines]|uniref:Uncharacterized protein n=1 Tax=Corynespora cassiicola Philippines TaxID=1448308 RepID=A0A2T2P822_CORCC|nr:hypothetical protein BS50DRAFT_193840 [Corynespora cassiicola Philippines]
MGDAEIAHTCFRHPNGARRYHLVELLWGGICSAPTRSACRSSEHPSSWTALPTRSQTKMIRRQMERTRRDPAHVRCKRELLEDLIRYRPRRVLQIWLTLQYDPTRAISSASTLWRRLFSYLAATTWHAGNGYSAPPVGRLSGACYGRQLYCKLHGERFNESLLRRWSPARSDRPSAYPVRWGWLIYPSHGPLCKKDPRDPPPPLQHHLARNASLPTSSTLAACAGSPLMLDSTTYAPSPARWPTCTVTPATATLSGSYMHCHSSVLVRAWDLTRLFDNRLSRPAKQTLRRYATTAWW